VAKAYVASAPLQIALGGPNIHVHYNYATVGTTFKQTSIISGTKHGLYTTDINNTFDGITIHERGGNA
jgi:hypothetical protein